MLFAAKVRTKVLLFADVICSDLIGEELTTLSTFARYA